METKTKKLLLSCMVMVVSLFGYCQNSVEGLVTDENGLPLSAVKILVVGTSSTVLTDNDGKYKIEVSSESTLSFSFEGFETQNIPTDGKDVINITLKGISEDLKEVIVIGYGTVKKSDLTGSVTTLKVKEVQDIPAKSIEQVLQGRVAGLQIQAGQGPGSTASVRIRGGSSLRGSNSPLVVLDGFPLGDAGDLKQISVNDIEKVEVLKDASASAIYGSRGANGVIMITTKKAKAGKTRISVINQTTVSQFNSKLNLWEDPVLMAEISNEGAINGGFQPMYIGAANASGIYYPSIKELQSGAYPATDWTKYCFEANPLSNNTVVTISSSTDKTSFDLSGNYWKEQGVYIDDTYKKGGYNFRVKHSVYDNLKISFTNILSKEKRNNNGGLAYWRNIIFPVFKPNGDYNLIGDKDYTHPVALTDKRKNESSGIDVITSAAIEWKIIPSLLFTTRANYKLGEVISDQYNPKIYTENGTLNNGAGYIGNWMGENFASETFVNYNNKFSKHDLGVTAGFTYENYTSRTSNLSAFGFVNETLENENMESGDPTQNVVSNSYTESELVSGLFRLNYSYNDRYLLTVTGRTDGSSKFGRNNQYAFFPSGAISWKAHEESFIQNLNTFDELKFRLSYGISGNQGIGAYQTLSRYGTSKYYSNGKWVTAIGPGKEVGTYGAYYENVIWGGIPNPDLKWETTAQGDFGIDMGFLKNRLNVVFDLYNKNTSDLLRERILPLSSGYDRVWVNDGEINNKGFEITVNADVIQSQTFNFTTAIVFSKNINTITSLGNAVQSGLNTDPNTGLQFEYIGNALETFKARPNILAIGQPINMFYGYKTNGIIQTEQEGINAGLNGVLAKPGEYKYVDINGDGIVNEKDQTIIGNPNPDFTASLNLGFNYKNFDLSVFFNGVFGQDVLNSTAFNQYGDAATGPLRWTPDNPTNTYPRLNHARQTLFSDWWLEDGSYVRVENVTFGYTFKKIKGIQSLRLNVNGNSLYTFTNFKGYDPAVGYDGIYWGGIPRLKKITFGLELNF